ncbi:MAG: hypothetical protein ACLT9P_03260 [Evtepia gabavorous]
MDWLHDPKNMKKYDKDEVDARTTYDLEKLRQMLEERLQEQHERHDGGQYWVGTGGTHHAGPLQATPPPAFGWGARASTATPSRVAGGGTSRLPGTGRRWTSGPSSWPSAASRQMTTRQDGPMDVLNLDRTIDETCNNAGYLQLEFDRPRTNDIKVMVLFDLRRVHDPLCPSGFAASSSRR